MQYISLLTRICGMLEMVCYAKKGVKPAKNKKIKAA